MNNASGMMRIGVTVPLISLIAIFLVLNMFFGAWILALPMATALALGIFLVGANRVKQPISGLAHAKASGLNLFGLSNLPRFYGFLHIFCWFIPPALFLVLWQIFGVAWLNAEFVNMAMGVIGEVSIDSEGMRKATNALFSNYYLGAELNAGAEPYAAAFTEAFNQKFVARRWFWAALVMAMVALWPLLPQDFEDRRSGLIPVVGLTLAAAALFVTGFGWASLGVALIVAFVAYLQFGAGYAPRAVIRPMVLGGAALVAIATLWAVIRALGIKAQAADEGVKVIELAASLGPNTAIGLLCYAGLALVGLALLFSVPASRLGALAGRVLTLFSVMGLIIFAHHITQIGRGGWIFSTLLMIAALVCLYWQGVRPNLRNAPTLILTCVIALFLISTAISVLDMLGWVENAVASDFGRPSNGHIDTAGNRVLRFVAEIRAGNDITPQLIKKARASQIHVDSAYEWIALNQRAQWMVYAGVLGSLVLGAILSVLFIRPSSPARQWHEAGANVLLIIASALAILVTIGLVLALLGQAEFFFAQVNAQEFLNELKWNKGGVHDGEDGVRKSTLGALPVFYGTLMISLIALAFAVPIGLFSAIYMSEYASKTIRNIFKPILEILAGVPTIVYGVFALLIVGPFFRDLWNSGIGPDGLGLSTYELGGRSALIAGAVMGIMLIPFISSLSDDALKAVPRPLRDGSLALGANKSETILKVLLPAALPGIMGGILLATSRAIGETMIVVLAAGRFAQIKANPLEPMTTVTVQIVEFLTGDIALDSPEALSAFGLGLVLFLATLVLNMIAIVIVRRFRLKYS